MTEQLLPLPSSLAAEFLRALCLPQESDGNEKHASALADWYVGCGQQRLLDALEICFDPAGDRHLFITGMSGPGALEAIRTHVLNYLESHKERRLVPLKDYAYLYNFKNPLKPAIYAFARGKGSAFRDDIHALLHELQEKVPIALRHEEVDEERARIIHETHRWWEDTQREFAQEAEEDDLYIYWDKKDVAHGAVINREKESQEDTASLVVYTPEEIQNMSEEQRREILEREMRWGPRTRNIIIQRDTQLQMMNERIEELERRVCCECIVEIFRPMREKWERISRSPTDPHCGNIADFCEQLQQYTEYHFRFFVPARSNEQHGSSPTEGQNPFLPWVINLLVDNSRQTIPPVVINADGAFEGIVGRIERMGGMHGMLYTDHSMITVGSIAQANGGYLIVDAMSMLTNIGSYDLLKRVMKNRSLKIEDIASFAGYGSMIPLQPAAIPISNMKVIMVGSPYLWSMLAYYDSDFLDYFEKAEVASEVAKMPQEIHAFAAWADMYARSKAMPSLDMSAMGRLVEHAGRLVGSQKKISTDFRKIEPVIIEAAHVAKTNQSKSVTREHVATAIARRFYRSTLHYERWLALMRDAIIIIPFSGESVGQITILGVTDFGDVRIGTPNLLTATWSMGRPGFVSIAHESRMAGNILRKGELTVQGYLQSLFAKKYPLAINITYGEEQVYGPVDGDSASQALLYCIISALSEIPIRQGIAITGSLSQHGAIQAIDGVNEKIEGFFDCCVRSKHGLTGSQGVIIPQSNTDDLMLDERVVEAVANGKFHIWPIGSIDDGLRILMGREAGRQQKDYSFAPVGSVLDTTDKKLQEIARNARTFFLQDDGI